MGESIAVGSCRGVEGRSPRAKHQEDQTSLPHHHKGLGANKCIISEPSKLARALAEIENDITAEPRSIYYACHLAIVIRIELASITYTVLGEMHDLLRNICNIRRQTPIFQGNIG